ncbi:phosphatidylglycerol-prolipoprotein diacylglyceryl transferase [Wigglesworthia glossinidia endosymbiont of Glossina morsitans morsitans (Yale colony)]|uniref:Phosphatidylglycerol--prolipoprotein diacylglyceryl transferase n=1 Tax=Wigglesworthia glossinidia endosymbiont of Glossina morsitans morsitans (Yale colony) TaxID=1142511 RepID=H6Q4Z8_WIGGL|nr:prolipoprotein diacylglyceryl transferase [Wigglesworthia glossinidia]AFA41281.1 phosphatidylglycerol-prolipoprotein diacylglyceryl transferase [Wigglesworthia glossinidia endosymbiont of Glossina morsitans morsitans (Yale colony)]
MTNCYLMFPQYNPILFSFGIFSIHWYGIMYLISFYFIMWCASKRIDLIHLNKKKIENILYYSFLSAVIGGRLGYVLLYKINMLFLDPYYIFKIWEGGMSFHGGLTGAICAMYYFSKRYRYQFFKITDFFAPLVPFGLGAGRIGNFINGELWGRVNTSFCLTMLFPNSRSEDLELLKTNPQWQIIFDKYHVLPRHMSQIYEMFLEGVLLFIILNCFVKKCKPTGYISGLFLLLYGLFRTIAEFFRQPDPQIGLLFNYLSLGQILSFPMIFIGIILIVYSSCNIKRKLK